MPQRPQGSKVQTILAVLGLIGMLGTGGYGIFHTPWFQDWRAGRYKPFEIVEKENNLKYQGEVLSPQDEPFFTVTRDCNEKTEFFSSPSNFYSVIIVFKANETILEERFLNPLYIGTTRPGIIAKWDIENSITGLKVTCYPKNKSIIQISNVLWNKGDEVTITLVVVNAVPDERGLADMFVMGRIQDIEQTKIYIQKNSNLGSADYVSFLGNKITPAEASNVIKVLLLAIFFTFLILLIVRRGPSRR